MQADRAPDEPRNENVRVDLLDDEEGDRGPEQRRTAERGSEQERRQRAANGPIIGMSSTRPAKAPRKSANGTPMIVSATDTIANTESATISWLRT